MMMATSRSTQEQHVLTVSQLTQAIKLSLEATFPYLAVQGEISNFKRHSSGHLYFSLKDSSSQLSAVMFRNAAQALPRLPKEGDKVLVKGEITVYPQRGGYQIVVQELSLAGVGDLLMQLEALKTKYKELGYFDAEHKKKLPAFPKKIGVITSPTGAVIQDILNILHRRHSAFHLILNPVRVQGDVASEEIAKAIDQFNTHDLADVLIVGRGGGSIEDLWAFNTEPVIEAIYRSKIPVISAVGHETDHTLADFVADVRAPTPSAAAEIVLAETAQRMDQLRQKTRMIEQAITRSLSHARQQLDRSQKHPMLATSDALLRDHFQRMDDLREAVDGAILNRVEKYRMILDHYRQRVLALKPETQIRHLRDRLQGLDDALKQAVEAKLRYLKGTFDSQVMRKRLDTIWHQQLALRSERLHKLVESLKATDPKQLLAKGYTILFSQKDGSAITTVQDLKEGDAVRLLLTDGAASATINETYPSDRKEKTK